MTLLARALVVALLVIGGHGEAASDPAGPAPFSSQPAGETLPSGWKPLAFGDVPRSGYALVREAGTIVVHAEADASASALAFRFATPVPAATILRWRWKGERMPEGGDTRRKASDDAVARLYVTFERPASQLSRIERMKDAAVRAMHGETPPHATLLYVWDARAPLGASFVNPYTDRVRNVVVESGVARLGEWLAYERDVASDYRAAFGDEPPPIRGIAIMTDADNTKSRAAAFYGDVSLQAR